ncbi:MAG: hypothetical protein AABZ23_04950 [Deltaproteobacteria bacterium]
MKIFSLPRLAELNEEGSYCLTRHELSTGSVYLRYFRLRPGEQGRNIKTPEGSEEVLYAAKGALTVKCGRTSFSIKAGEAFHPDAKEEVTLNNPTDSEAVCIAAGSISGAQKPDGPVAKQTGSPANVLTKERSGQDKALDSEAKCLEETEFDISKDDTPEEEPDNC